eukprot:scaffold198988_cov32-Tisochrysis_lutea.AAC.2
MNNTQDSYDPVRDAFAVYDPHQTGFIDTGTLRRIFHDLGYGEIADEDVDVLVHIADFDRDGNISLEDFRRLISTTSAG